MGGRLLLMSWTSSRRPPALASRRRSAGRSGSTCSLSRCRTRSQPMATMAQTCKTPARSPATCFLLCPPLLSHLPSCLRPCCLHARAVGSVTLRSVLPAALHGVPGSSANEQANLLSRVRADIGQYAGERLRVAGDTRRFELIFMAGFAALDRCMSPWAPPGRTLALLAEAQSAEW